MKIYEVRTRTDQFTTADYIVASCISDIEKYFGKDTEILEVKLFNERVIILN